MTLAALVLTIVCQGYPACEMTGYPMLGVVASGESDCIAIRLNDGAMIQCDRLGGIVPLGTLYQFPIAWPGEVVALDFTEAP